MPNPAPMIDPFFDRDAYGNVAVGTGEDNPAGYTAVDRETQRRMPTGTSGLSGVIIPRATAGGVPQGLQPHVMQDMQVTYDPHMPGQSVTLRLGDITPATMQAAIDAQARQEVAPANDATARYQESAVMRKAAQMVQQQIHSDFGQAAPPMLPPAAPQSRRFSPLAAFNASPSAVVPSVSRAVAAMPAISNPPGVRVLFEMEHFGELPVSYHDVIVETGFLVLVYDTQYQGGMKYFPPTAAADGAPKLAARIVGAPEVYLLQTTGVQFTHGPHEFCVLLVERVVVVPE